MTRKAILECDGDNPGCHKRLEVLTRTMVTAEEVASRQGWRFPRRKGMDLCPVCAPASDERCIRCHPAVEFAGTFGHDRIGHQVVNALARWGVSTWDRLADLPPGEVLRIPGLGAKGKALLEQRAAARQEQERAAAGEG